MINTTQTTVRDIALAAPATTRVFEEFKIDYCCGGRRSIADVCAASGIDQAVLEKRLDEVMSRDASAEKFPENMAPAELIGHILDSHHVFTKAELARLAPLMQKVVTRHGEHHPELSELGQIFEALRASLEPHMMKEENVLFPYIQRLCSGRSG
jgi:regulator of cell morphogenesis and NO signaling